MEQLNQLFLDAGILMLAGMVFVFVFLGILVLFINKILTPLADKFPDATPKTPVRQSAPAPQQGLSNNVVAAISAAVTQYRHNNKIQ